MAEVDIYKIKLGSNSDTYNLPFLPLNGGIMNLGEGLKFHRGRPKNSITELTKLEKKDLEIAKLKLELEKHKRAEEILKKNLEIRKQLFKDSRK